MKVILNKCYGGFSLSQACADKHSYEIYPWQDDARTDPQLVAEVEHDADWASGESASLYVVDIPDNTTDWYVDSDDGFESIIYVVDGKLHWA